MAHRPHRTALLVPLLLVGAVGAAHPDAGDRVLLTPAQALAAVFPGHGPVTVDRFLAEEAVRRAILDASGAPVPPGPVDVLRVAGRDGRPEGWALVLDERGKYRPITFMVGIGVDLEVRAVEVMVYREDRGDEVRHARFLRQYREKGPGDPVRAGGDIVNITGATLSVHALNRGVRRALATVAALYGEEGATPVDSHPFDAGR